MLALDHSAETKWERKKKGSLQKKTPMREGFLAKLARQALLYLFSSPINMFEIAFFKIVTFMFINK